MKILITGGAGFIGSNMVSKLIEKKDNYIVVVDNLSTGKYKNIEKYVKYKNFEFIKLDITKQDFVDYLKANTFDYIFNFACPASPKYYLNHPIETWESSVIGIKNLLDGIINSKTKLFHSSTSEVYGDAIEYPQSETYWGNVNPIGVRACYDEGKRAAESLIFDYIRKYGVDVRVARIFNTYGPNMSIEDGRIISNFIVQSLENKDITINGTGEQTRSFCYIDDTLNFIILLMKNANTISDPINVGNPYEMSVNDVAQKIKRMTNSSSNIVHLVAMKDDPQRRMPNISKAQTILGWEPLINFDDGLNKTIEYFQSELKVGGKIQ